jgi:hypothetical protein
MKIVENNSEKRMYNSPEIISIELDNEISLALQSPPEGPGEGVILAQEYHDNNPYKSQVG